ncbi:ORF6N domain-containing protein [Azorhizobium caulinodans]|uniref:ORF6N domain-containing protein n=1 Tax=Azorhizobium caulinodans TaxID=7 RepID=UPI002FBE8669
MKVEVGGQRVITLRQIDEVHDRPEGTARRQFNANRQRFTEGRDFLKMSADEFRTRFPGLLSDRATEDLTLFTERGYGKIVKGWNDDLAWALHDAMQDAYFLMRAVAGAVQSGGLTEADWKRIGGIIKSVVVKQTEDVRAGADLCLEEVARLGRELAAVREAPVVPAFDFAGTVTSRDMMDMAGIPQTGRVRGTTGGVITRAMKDFCLARGLPARKTPEDIDPDRRWRFPRTAALEWLNGPSLGKEVIRNHIAIATKRAARRGRPVTSQGVLTFPVERHA